ncbi:hypothetical protein FRC01_002082 [Tulasnella sp. 417]|nr:hypothetical protein FRC01_002082 [Tulasnella sp. 417]
MSLMWKYILDREGYSSYVNEIWESVVRVSGSQELQLPGGFTPAVVSLMALAASRAEVSDIWDDVHGPYTANAGDMPEHINNALIRRLISRYGRGWGRSREDYMLVTLLRIAIRLVPAFGPNSVENALTGIRLLALGDSVMLLRDPNLATPALQLGKSFREDHAFVLKKIFKQVAEGGSAIPVELGTELVDYFQSLMAYAGRPSAQEEDFWVVSLFSPIFDELFGPSAGKQHQATVTEIGFQRRRLLQAFGELKDKVYKVIKVENEKLVHFSPPVPPA